MPNNISNEAPKSQAAKPKGTALEGLLTEGQAADFLNVTKRALQAWRQRGGGPDYVKAGSLVRYRPVALTDFVDANTRRHTSDPGAAG